MPERVTFAVVAAITESFISRDCFIESTYSFGTKEVLPKPALLVYAAGTVTVPVPFGESTKFPFESVVEIVFPSVLTLSTSNCCIPASVVELPPIVRAVEPIVKFCADTAPLETVK